jgi:hypothetical protein
MGNGRETELWVPRVISGSILNTSVVLKYCIFHMQEVCFFVYERELNRMAQLGDLRARELHQRFHVVRVCIESTKPRQIGGARGGFRHEIRSGSPGEFKARKLDGKHVC